MNRKTIWLLPSLGALLVAFVAPQAHEAADLPKKPESPRALKAKIEGLRAEKVAWRQIQWKACLLEGLKESREKKRPMLVWVFIDRPADDRRC